MIQRSSAARDVLIGAAAGLLATAPMTAFMWGARTKLRWYERYSLPPRQITRRVLRSTGLAVLVADDDSTTVTAAAHFGYGAAMGALYGLISGSSNLRHPLTGVPFGLSVWAGSYLGLLPALGILRPATEHPARRTALMIGAHVVWGATLGYLTSRIRRHKQPM